jgi:arylsulfatase A-like enzyme
MGALEGGLRVPACVRWPGRVSPQSVVAAPTSLLDWKPTLNHILQEDNGQEVKESFESR